MNLTPISSIKIAPNRQRREFDPAALAELVESIWQTKAGLLHAPVLRAEGSDLILVAGERRLRALQDIIDLGGSFNYSGAPVPPGQVPYTLLTDLTPLEAWEAELEENIRRVDLTWMEKAQATSELMRLRTAQAIDSGSTKPTTAAISLEIRGSAEGIHQETTRRELIVARHAADPEVAKAPTLKEAFKILKKKEEIASNIALTATIGKTFNSTAHSLLHRDWFEGCAPLPTGSFEIILTDPPYGMGADEFGDSGQGVGASAHFYEDSYDNWKDIMSVLPDELFRLAAVQAHAYLFCDLDRFPELRTRMQSAGWKVHRTPLIWANPDGFRAPWPDQGPQRKYELILYAVKGDRKTNSLQSDVLTYRKDQALGHPAQKPVALLQDLLRRSARPGDRVLDPFMGSGSTIEAAHGLKLAATGIEGDAGAFGIAVKRIQGLEEAERGLL